MIFTFCQSFDKEILSTKQSYRHHKYPPYHTSVHPPHQLSFYQTFTKKSQHSSPRYRTPEPRKRRMRVCARSRGHSEDGQKKAASGRDWNGAGAGLQVRSLRDTEVGKHKAFPLNCPGTRSSSFRKLTFFAQSVESPGAGTDPPPAFPGFVRFLYLINLSSYFFELRIVKL